MNIVGIILVFALPYMAGYILKCILNSKETSQIETYLTGFFFVFLLQGLYFVPGYMFLKWDFYKLCNGLFVLMGFIVAIFLILALINFCKYLKRERHDNVYHAKMNSMDWSLLAIMVVIMIFIIVRVVMLRDYLRTDILLPTVRTTLSTGKIYEYNPITSQPFTLGMITSKKIISLPIYYSALCHIWGLDESVFLYIILTIQTIMCTYFACMLFIIPVLRNRRKILIFAIFLSGLIISGDYFSGAIGARLLWNGYAGESIVAGVMLPYIFYVLTNWFRQKRGNDEDGVELTVVRNIFKLVLCLAATLFIASAASGVLLISIEIVILGACCYARYIAEVRKK